MTDEEEQKLMAEIFEKSQYDMDLREQLIKDPRKTLGGFGIEVPDMEIIFVENTDDRLYVVLPPRRV